MNIKLATLALALALSLASPALADDCPGTIIQALPCFARLAQASGRVDQRVKYSLQVKSRAADDHEHFGGGGLLLKGFAQFVN